MKMRIFSFETEICFTDDFVDVIQVKNHKLFGNLVNSIYKMSNGVEEGIQEQIVLEEDEKILNFSKETMFIMDFMNFDFNQRKIQNALYRYVEEVYNLEYERFDSFQTSFYNLNLDMFDILVELPFEYECKENIEVQDYLKMIGLKIKQHGEQTVLERLLLIMDVIHYFRLAKVLFLVNVKSFLEKEELVELYKYSKYKKISLVILESGIEVKPVDYEKILFIDSDYDEILLYNNR
ncbi:MAG: type II-A CRISPR-associated protein Csn2 [Lachnospiraceae bacterium]|nr:type II-A CRISPR-associated protein Csn2 [Lachnospiraceae bacterium]